MNTKKNDSHPCVLNEHDANEIIPGLWLGNLKSSIDENFLNKHNIENIITVYQSMDSHSRVSNVKYHIFPFSDKDTCDKNIPMMFEITNSIIFYLMKNKKPVLVHCKRGHHRSSSVIAAFLIKYLDMSIIDALQCVRSMRLCAFRRKTCMVDGLLKYNYLLKMDNFS